MNKFNTLANARSFSNRCNKPQTIILGCDSLFWVVSMAEGAKLIRKGYEAV